jgi:predicted transcriptional regulator
VRDVHEALKATRGSVATATSKMMQVMCDKGLLTRDESRRPQVYGPAVPEEQTQRRIVGDLIQRVFGGSARQMVMRAVETEHVTPAELAEIRKLLDRMEGDKS